MKKGEVLIYIYIIISFLLIISLSSALETGIPGRIGIDLIPEPPEFVNGTAFVNQTNFWITNLGSLGNANDTQFSNNVGILNLLESWLTSTFFWNLSGTNLFPNSLGFNVGIGTATPSGKLSVANIADGEGINFTGLNFREDPILSIIGSGEAGGAGGDLGLLIDVMPNALAQNLMHVKSTGTSVFIVDAIGKVGIGVEDPNQALDVSGTLVVSDSIGIGTPAPISSLHVNGTNARLHLEDSGNLVNWGIGSTGGFLQFAQINSLGQFFGVGSILRISPGIPSLIEWNVANVNASFQVNSNVSDSAFYVRGDDGNVGIGTNAPESKIDVIGSLFLNGDGAGFSTTYGDNQDAQIYFNGSDLIDNALTSGIGRIFTGFKNYIFGTGTNHSEFEADGTLVFHGNATVFDDLRIPGSSVQKGASAPDLGAFLGAGSLLVNRFNGAATLEQIYFTVQLPHSYKEGTNISPHVHWTPTDGNAGHVNWSLEYSWANITKVFPASNTISGRGNASVAWNHTQTFLGDIDGSEQTISSMLVGRLFRDPTVASDDYGSDAAFLEIDFHYEINTVGSRGRNDEK